MSLVWRELDWTQIWTIGEQSTHWIWSLSPWYNYTYTYTCGNIINNNDERTQFFRKIYLSHFILERVAKGCVWEVSWRWNRDCNILTPSSSDYSSISSSFCWAAQPGSWGPNLSVRRWLSLRHLVPNNDWNTLPRTKLCLPRAPNHSSCLWHQVI